MVIEGARRFIFGVHHQSADAGDVGSLNRAQQRILEQALAEPPACQVVAVARRQLTPCKAPISGPCACLSSRRSWHGSGTDSLRFGPKTKNPPEGAGHVRALARG